MNGLLFIINTAGRLELHTEEELPSIVVERCANYLKTGKILSGTYEIKATGEKKFTSTVDFILKKDNLVTLDGKSPDKSFSLEDVQYRNAEWMIGCTLNRNSGLEKTLYHFTRLLHLDERKSESNRIFHRLFSNQSSGCC